MNKYSLQFKSAEFELAFFQNQKDNTILVLKVGTIINILQSIVILIFYLSENDAHIQDKIMGIIFFVVGVASWCVKIQIKKFQKFTNSVLFFKNCIICIVIGIYQLSKDSIHSNSFMGYQPLLGILLAVEFITSIQGTNFLFKILMCAVNIVFFSLAFYGNNSACLVIAISLGAFYFLLFIYLNDKQKRDLFLDKQKSQELSFLIDKLLPINIVVMKYNPKEERSFLHQVNRKAQNTFNISDNDAFKEFSKRVIVKQDIQDDLEKDSQNSDENINNKQNEQEKTLFFQIESIAKENYLRQRQDKNKASNEKRQSLAKSERNSKLIIRTDKIQGITKLQRNKINSLFERPKKLSDEVKYNERVNSGEKERVQRFSVFEPSKASSYDRNKNNSIDRHNRPKESSLERTKNISIEKNNIGSNERVTHNSVEKNKTLNNSVDKERPRYNLEERSKKISFEKDKQSNNIATPHHARGSKRSSTVKIDNATTGSGGPAGGKFVRRVQKKGTILRKVSNFNLKSGVANSKVKYGEDVYDRIDIFQGVYTQKDGSQRQISIKIYTYNVNEQYQVILIEDETLEGQVKFLRELNKFLYRSFSESLEQFRMPLAYSLMKLNENYENLRAGKEEKSPTSCTNFNQYHHKILDGNRQSLSQIQQSDLSQTNISPINKHKHTTTNNSIFYSTINNILIKNPENFSVVNQDINQSQSLNNIQQYIQDVPSSRRRANSLSQDSIEKIYESINNTRYYGFLTLNKIYNYIDYISLLQKKQIELRLSEMSIKRIINDVQKVVEYQACKKKVKIVFINELKYDRITSDERRIKQLLLNFLVNILHKTSRGYIIVRASTKSKQLETIKISIYNSGNYTYPIQYRAKFKLNSISDILNAKKNKDCLEQAINSQIVGKLGPYDKVSVSPGESGIGSTLSFLIYTDLNILNLPHKFISADDVDLQLQSGFKSVANIQQEGEISDVSSYDATYNMNKLQVENQYEHLNKSFFPLSQFQDIATIYEREDLTQMYLSSKIQNLAQKQQLIMLDIQNEKSNLSSSFQYSSLHPITNNQNQQSYEPSFQFSNLEQKLKNFKNAEETLFENQNNKDNSKIIDQYDQKSYQLEHNNEDDDNQILDYEGENQSYCASNKITKNIKNKLNESISSNNRDIRSQTNSYSYPLKQENASRRMTANSREESKQFLEQKQKANAEQNKILADNSTVTLDQIDENSSPRLHMDTVSALQSQQFQQPFSNNKNSQRLIITSDISDNISKQKLNTSNQTNLYNEDKFDNRISVIGFSSRYTSNNNSSNIQYNEEIMNSQKFNSSAKQKANIIKLQQSNVDENNIQNQNKHSNINITMLNHIQ
ncbi:hypothetical protein ABPG72_002237 [Tetrahymena utriculariae]